MTDDRKHILVIEDDRDLAQLLAEDLVERGYAVVLAFDGKTGIDAIMRERPDLVLCDINLPYLSGYDVLKRLTDNGLRVGTMPFLFLTALDDRNAELNGRKLGADDYITKPVDFEMLSIVIAARLRHIERDSTWARTVRLNAREISVLTWAARGKTSHEVAIILNLAKRTVDFYIDRAKVKLGAATRSEALVKAVSGGLIKP